MRQIKGVGVNAMVQGYLETELWAGTCMCINDPNMDQSDIDWESESPHLDNLGYSIEDYSGKIPENSNSLIGIDYCLVGDRFKKLYRTRVVFKNLLFYFGGGEVQHVFVQLGDLFAELGLELLDGGFVVVFLLL
jgi:hypothetical protein